jgi:hypothetical protein
VVELVVEKIQDHQIDQEIQEVLVVVELEMEEPLVEQEFHHL